MKKMSLVKVIGFMGAAVLIVFGSVGNFIRTLRLGLDKISQR